MNIIEVFPLIFLAIAKVLSAKIIDNQNVAIVVAKLSVE